MSKKPKKLKVVHMPGARKIAARMAADWLAHGRLNPYDDMSWTGPYTLKSCKNIAAAWDELIKELQERGTKGCQNTKKATATNKS